ncbi:MAG TPA: family 78 glycoside hydrolase catalytic domain [Chloroflexota bacterium]|nr:family 78 glycoside hydrolase catalytic domain [Chloroflexota bacterium]
MGALSVDRPTVERRSDPLGIDAAQPRFAWRVTGEGAAARQSAYQMTVDEQWDSGRRESGDSTYVPYEGPPLEARRTYTWRVRVWDANGEPSDWSAPASFEMGLLEPDDWSAQWIAHIEPDLFSEPEERRRTRPAPLLRRRFSVPNAPTTARLYITACGLYEAFVNGARVGEERLAPGWTDYHRRIQYQTADVTSLLRAGDNVLAVRLGDGWYSGTVGPWGRGRYGDMPALLCQLEAEDGAGQRVTVGSDELWVASASGTWVNDLQHGERTDFTKQPANWSDVSFDDGAWDRVSLRAAPGSRLVANRDDGIRVVETLAAVSVTAKGDGRHIVDLGANAAGVVRLRTNGSCGQHIVVRHAEALDANGELYIENLRGAEQRDEFLLASDGEVTLEPQLTFHGFRYAEVSGVDGATIESRVLSSATRQVGWFSCSDERVDKLQRNIVTSLRANFISVPTDCPQRNERLGWTADLQIFAPTALFNADLSNMLDKWLDDMVDAQLPSGAYTDVAPAPSGWSGAGNTAWSDAGVIVPWVLYERSGDTRVLPRMYESMARYMAFLKSDQTDGLRFAGRYGDWVSLGARTDKVFIGTAYLAYVADTFARIAAVVGEGQDEQKYRAFGQRVRDAWRERFVTRDGSLNVETQTAYAMALGFGLLPEQTRAVAGGRLAALVEEAGRHLATGFLGTPLVMPALSDNGHHELACQLMQQDTYPSWLFEVQNGATSIWERWNGWTPEQGFYSPRMNSFNHYAFGAVGDWMYRYLAGLEPLEPGYRRVLMRPRPGAGFTAASARHESLYGVHECSWRIEHGQLRIETRVPANTSARVVLPDGEQRELDPGRHEISVNVAVGG